MTAVVCDIADWYAARPRAFAGPGPVTGARIIDMTQWKAKREREAVHRYYAGPPLLPPRHTLDDIMRNGPWCLTGGTV